MSHSYRCYWKGHQTTEVVRIKPRILSPTVVNTYLSCPYKYYLRYIKKLRAKPTIYMIRGMIVHQALQEFHNSQKGHFRRPGYEDIKAQLTAIFTARWDNAIERIKKMRIGKKRLQKIYLDSIRMIDNYSQWYASNNVGPVAHTEARFYSKDKRILGIVDAIHDTAEGAILIDYKTALACKMNNDTFRQSAIYALLFNDHFGYAPKEVWIHFLNSRQPPKIIHVDEHLLDYAQTILDFVRAQTISKNKSDYPCCCGGKCHPDFAHQNGSN